MSKLARLHGVLVGDDPMAQACRDLPESACRAQPRNYSVHVTALGLTKVGEGLADTKLVLIWLLAALGTPVWALGLLVPIRESLAMLPQLVISAHIRKRPLRKPVYITGCIIQAITIMGFAVMAWYAPLLSANLIGVFAVMLIAVFALGRSLCSIAHKDVLAKTVDMGKRGSVSGLAGTVAAVVTLTIAVSFSFGWLALTVPVVSTMVMIGGLCWLIAAICFTCVDEKPGETSGGVNGLSAVIGQLGVLKTDWQLRRFIITRALLLSTALAPPFYMALSETNEASGLGSLGLFMLAGAGASLLSTYIWGRFSDKSSKRVLIYAALIAAGANALVAFFAIFQPRVLGYELFLPILLLILMIAHQGVRLGRSVHVVDMANSHNRATYTALSNSLVGLILLIGGAFGIIAQWFGVITVLVIFTFMAILAVVSAMGLDDVQQT